MHRVQYVISRMLKPRTKILDRTQSFSTTANLDRNRKTKIWEKAIGANLTHCTWRLCCSALVGLSCSSQVN